jgi:DNA-binding transcriptional LysR family regulator
MEFTSLRYFFETVKAGSIRQAAEHIHVAPSAISRQIAKLEHELGAALFERRSTGVRLTPAGEILAGQLQSTVRDLMRVRGQIDELNGLRRGDVTIHCIEGLIDTFLPAVIAAFNSRYPEIRFHVTVASTDGIIDALVSDDADIGIALNAPGRMEISVCGGWAEPLHAIVAPSHPLSARKGLHLAELARFPAALPDASFGVRRLVDRMLAKGDLTPNVLVTTNSILATNCIVRQGIAYTLMPVFAVAGDLESGSLIAIPLTDRGLEPTRVQVCIHKNRRLPVAAAELLASLIASLPNPAKAARRPTKPHPEGIARAPSAPAFS